MKDDPILRVEFLPGRNVFCIERPAGAAVIFQRNERLVRNIELGTQQFDGFAFLIEILLHHKEIQQGQVNVFDRIVGEDNVSRLKTRFAHESGQLGHHENCCIEELLRFILLIPKACGFHHLKQDGDC